MIADVYKCPECNVNVYLAKDEEYCPLCGNKHRKEMKRKKQDVDLSADASLKDDATYAHFGHFTKLMDLIYGEEAGLYLMDCWKYAWDATKVDSENLDKMFAFVDNPNGVLSKKRNTPMTKAELQTELERIINVILSKCKFPRNYEESYNNTFKFEKNNPVIRFFVKKDFTHVAAEACFSHTHMSQIYNFVPVEKDNPTPKTLDGYFVFYKILQTDVRLRKEFAKTPRNLAKDIVFRCHVKPNSIRAAIERFAKRCGLLFDDKMKGVWI